MDSMETGMDAATLKIALEVVSDMIRKARGDIDVQCIHRVARKAVSSKRICILEVAKVPARCPTKSGYATLLSVGNSHDDKVVYVLHYVNRRVKVERLLNQ